MKYCSHCGAQIDDNSNFCSNCGCRVYGGPEQGAGGGSSYGYDSSGYYDMNGPAHEAVYTVVKKMRTSATLWTVIAVYQILAGLATICYGYGILPICLGIYNLVQCSRERSNASAFESAPAGIVGYFESRGTSLIVFMILNLIVGAVVGVIGSLYDMHVRNTALSLRGQLLDAENIYRKTGVF